MVANGLGTQGRDAVGVVICGPRHLPALAAFYRDIWDPSATEESVARARAEGAARNPVAPGTEVPTFLFVKGDSVLGHLSTIPVQLWTGTGQRPAYWFIGFMVRPEHRNGPVGALLLKEAVQALELTLSLTVALPSVRLFRAVGFTDLGLVPNYVRVLRAGRMLRRLDPAAIGLEGGSRLVRGAMAIARRPPLSALAGGVGQVALETVSALRSARGRGTVGSSLPGHLELDGLWSTARGRMGHLAARDAGYLTHRYPIEGGPYHLVALRHAGALLGVAYLREPRIEGDPRLAGIRVATLSDLVAPLDRARDALQLLRGAEREARHLGADALLASVSHRALPPLLARRGYMRFGGNLRFLVRDARRELPGTTALDDWWVSRGDMNADSVF